MKDSFSDALIAIHNHGVICYPTEGVWGLGCHPQSQQAFECLLDIKKRPIDKGVILLAANLDQASVYARIDTQLEEEVKRLQHEFITFILPKSNTCPSYVSGKFDSVAVRLTQYAPLRELCLRAETAIVSTSANISGNPPVKKIKEAHQTFGNAVDAYIDMPLGGQAKSSRILAWKNQCWAVIRE